MTSTTNPKPPRPMFYFYGGKYRASATYPAPRYGRIIEPFAGGANYALRYHWLNVDLYDLDEAIVGVWEYLIRSTPEQIRQLPVEPFDHVDDLPICQEARWLIGFWLNKGTQSPRKQPSKWMRSGTTPNTFWGAQVRERLASQVDLVSHWNIHAASYEEAPDVEATWCIDPPYDNAAGRQYRQHDIDYAALGAWCKDRQGQVMVCENAGADWLPFEPWGDIRHSAGRVSKEVMWHRTIDETGF